MRASYPNRPIKVVVPFSPGGETDTFARIIQEGVEDNHLLPVPLVIVNRNGAGATLGSRSVKNAPPDGYTVLCLHNALFTAKYAGNAPYGPEAFAPVAGTGEFGMVVAVAQNSSIDDLKQLMRRITEAPKSVTFGVNLGTPSHFAALMLENAAPGARFQFTQSGSGVDRYSDVIGGHVDVSAFSIGEYVRFDGLRALAFFGKQRHPGAPTVPTAREQGFKLTTSNMQFWWFPKGTKKQRVDYLAGVLQKAMQTPQVRKKLQELHVDEVFVSGARLHKRIDSYTRKLESVSLRPAIALPNFPALVIAAVLALSAAVFLAHRITRPSDHIAPIAQVGRTGRRRFFRLLIAGSATVGFVAALQFQLLPFPIATAAFVAGLGLSLTGLRPISLFVFAVLALLLGAGLHLVFTRLFSLDLP